MMHKYLQIAFLLLFTLLLLSSCKTKQYSYDTFDGNILAIGSSGGFTGASSKFYVFDNGQLFKSTSAGNQPQELGRIDEKLTKQQFENYYTLGFDKLTLDDPGNMSYFIIMHPNTDNQHILKWGGGSTEPSTELQQYYKLLSAIIKKHNAPTT